jgi:ADP-heptose:LPS heptosyltransferase
MSERAQPVALVLRALGLGDFFTGLPALAMLRRALPDHHVVLAVPRQFTPLVRLAGTVDAVVHGHELEPLVDAPQRPEIAVDLHGNGPASRQLLLDCAPRRLVAFGLDGPMWRDDEHEVTRWCRLISEGLPAPHVPVPAIAGALPVPLGIAAPPGLTVLHCGAKAKARQWLPERFAALAAHLQAAGHRVAISAGPGEEQLGRSIAAASGARVLDSVSLLMLLAIIASARLVVSGDTGVAHVATNYRTPSVVLFGPVSPAIWGPPPDPRHQVLWRAEGRGDPHGDTPDPALLAITVSEVAAACERALAGAELAMAYGG